MIAKLISGGTAVDESSAVVDFATAKSALSDRVDGRYADSAAAVRIAMEAMTYQKLEGLPAVAVTVGYSESAYEYLVRKSGGVRVSSNVPAPAANNKVDVIFSKGGGHAISPVWEGVTIVPDVVTKASLRRDRFDRRSCCTTRL